MSAEDISKKLKTFAHTEYCSDRYSSPNVIKEKIEKKEDLFNRGYKYKKIELDNSFPKYLLQNNELYKEYIL